MTRRVAVGAILTALVLLAVWPRETAMTVAGLAFVALLAVGIYCLVDAAAEVVIATRAWWRS